MKIPEQLDESTACGYSRRVNPAGCAPFVDPRACTSPRAPRPAARLTANAADLAKLHQLCRSGRLYDVERWIQAGGPLQLSAGSPPERQRHRTALEIALDRQDHALVLLLVANGYDLALEQESPLDTVLRLRRRDLLDLLLEWGADPLQVDLDTLLETYDSQLLNASAASVSTSPQATPSPMRSRTTPATSRCSATRGGTDSTSRDSRARLTSRSHIMRARATRRA